MLFSASNFCTNAYRVSGRVAESISYQMANLSILENAKFYGVKVEHDLDELNGFDMEYEYMSGDEYPILCVNHNVTISLTEGSLENFIEFVKGFGVPDVNEYYDYSSEFPNGADAEVIGFVDPETGKIDFI